MALAFDTALSTLVATKRYSTKSESFRCQHWWSLPRLLFYDTSLCTQLVGGRESLVEDDLGITVTVRWSNFVSPCVTFTSVCSQCSLVRLLVSDSRRDKASAERLSAMDRPALSDLDVASNTCFQRVRSQELPLFVRLAVASPPCRAVFVPKTPDILHLVSLSCSSGLCTARASSDPRTLCHEMGLHGTACPSMRFSSVAIHKNPH